MSQTVIITGGNGFVGRHLLRELRQAWGDARLIVWDRDLQTLPSGVEGVMVDITDPSSYSDSLTSIKPTWLIHLAAMTAVGESIKDPDRVLHVNAVASDRLFEAVVQKSPATKIFAVSSSDIYGTAPRATTGELLPELPLREAQPANPYAQSKLVMEQSIERSFNAQTVRVRPFPHIGPGQRRGFVTADFASQIAAIEAGTQKPVLRVGNLEAKRDFTDVRDVVRAYRLLLEKAPLGEVFHVASGCAISIKDILGQLLAMSLVAIKVEQDPGRLRRTDIPVLVGDATKLRQITGWQTEIPLEQSLLDILAYWRSQVAMPLVRKI